ncbi:MAG: D-alanyl-D-alanine carboxypeptidase family protein [Pseudomonadota bacterium]
MVRLFRRLLTGVCVVMLACVSPRAATAGPTLLIDDASGRVLYAEDADQLWYPASLTKIMTAYLAFRAVREGRLAMDKKIPVSERANKMPASKIGLPVGAEMGLELAIRTVIIKSANDVSVMLAEAIDGSVEGFVANMNRTARRLGMTSTTFENPNGLPAAGQMTTARDLALLTRAVVREFPEHLHYWATPTVRVGRARLRSQNALLRSYEGATGFKTGFICDSGFNIVATAERDGRRLIAIVLGESSSADRTARARALLDHGFKRFAWKMFLQSPTVAALPKGTSSPSAPSVRSSIRSWDCRRRRTKPRRTTASRPKPQAAQVRGQSVQR